MKSDRKPLSELFFLNRSISSIQNDDYEEQQQYILVLEKKLLQAQSAQELLSKENLNLSNEIKQFRDKAIENELKLDEFYSQMKVKEQMLQEFEASVRAREMEIINRELRVFTQETQTDEVTIEQPTEQNPTNDEVINSLWQKRITLEYQKCEQLRLQIEQREKAVQIRENKIKWFMQQVQK